MASMRPVLTTPPTRSGGPRRFPVRTILLMVLALFAFGRFWWITHHHPGPPARSVPGPGRPRAPIPARPIAPGEQH